jgi:hypothetical protein
MDAYLAAIDSQLRVGLRRKTGEFRESKNIFASEDELLKLKI